MSRTAAERREPPSDVPSTRYEDDLYTWVQEQVALLREGRVDDLDLRNIAEELSDVGSERYEQLESAFRVLLMHMLTWDGQPERTSRSWEGSIDEQRDRIEALLRKNPGLKSRVTEAVAAGYRQARRWAAIETGLPRGAFPEACPYDWEAMTEREFRVEQD